MDNLARLIIFMNIYCVFAALNITELRGPDSIKYGSAEEIILDCDFYADSDSEKDLELKWYYNNESNMIYQWIPHSNKSVYTKYKDHIDVNYIATNDSNTKHRALRIFNLTTDLSGNYTCKVSSFQGEDTETKQLIIYDVPESPLEVALIEEEQAIVCTAHRIFPEPEINLYFSAENSSKVDVTDDTLNNTVESEKDENGFYNITKIYFFPNMSSFPGNSKFICDLSIPGTDFLRSQTVIYKSVDYDLVEEEYIWNSYENYTSQEEYSSNMEEKSGVICASSVSLSTILTIVFLILAK